MSSIAEELEAAALSLPPNERARLARRLIVSLEEEDEVGEAWRHEVKRRLEAYRGNEVESPSATEVMEEARERLTE